MTATPVLKDGQYLTGAWSNKIRFVNIRDGSSNTFLAGEMHIQEGMENIAPYNGPIFNGFELDGHSRLGGAGVPILTGRDEPGALLGFGSAHSGTCNFVFADGSTHSISNGIDTVVLANLCNRADGDVIGSIQ